ncbi:MAG: hypothetical protein ACRD0G_05475 [Acidimicrobiales bacterium]
MTDPAVTLLWSRLARDLARSRRPFPEFAASVVLARGLHAAGAEQFARLLGVPVAQLEAYESGWRSPDWAPRRLAALAPELDWIGVGLRPRGDPIDPASRHPANVGSKPTLQRRFPPEVR